MKQAIKTLFLIILVLSATVAKAEGFKVGYIDMHPHVEKFASANGYDCLIHNFHALLFVNKKNDVTNALISAFNSKQARP